MANKRAQRAQNWGFEEIRSLISVWEENYSALISTKRNRSIYEKMAAQLYEYGVDRTHVEVQMKVKNLTTDYRSERNIHGCTPTGSSPSRWPHFAAVHKIIGNSKNSTCRELDPEQSSVTSDNEQSKATLTNSKEQNITLSKINPLILERYRYKAKRGNYCRFNGCKNTNNGERCIEGLHFYRFPKDKNRCEAWLKAVQNPKLNDKTPTWLHTCACICSVHFQDWCFMNINTKSRLVHNAIPATPKPQRVSHVTSEASTNVEVRRHVMPMEKTPQTMKQELVESEEEEPQTPTVSSPLISSVNTVTTSINDSNPTASSPKRQSGVTLHPVISKLTPQTNQREDDEELELYLKLLGKKLKNYKGLERRQIMHEIDGVFLRITPPYHSTSKAPQFLKASFENSVSNSPSNEG